MKKLSLVILFLMAVHHCFAQGNITFADGLVKSLCVANWDTNDDGELSYVEAGAVTDLGTVFGYKNTITSFNELQYFINLLSIGRDAFRECSDLISIELPNSLTSIDPHAFSGCTGLTLIEIPNSVTSIGPSAFWRCSGLEQIIVASGNTVYDSRDNCNAIIHTSTNELVLGCKNTVIPDIVTSIGPSAFSGCSGLTSITIPNLVTLIGDSAFSGCSSLTSVTIPNSVTSIGNGAFSGCSGLTSVTIPNFVTSIGYDTFNGCSGLTSVTIPNSVTSIGFDAFYGCSSLTSVYYLGDIIQWCGIEYVDSFSYAYNLYFNNQLVTDLVIPNSMTSIRNGAFHNCTSLTSIEIPNSVSEIGGGAFYGCIGLTGNLIIPNSVTSIGNSAFYNCSGLTSVTISNSLTSIGYNVFSGCSGMTSLTIPDSVTSIEYGAFSYCSGLMGNLIIPNSVTSIGNYAFNDCSGLNLLTIGNSVDTIGECAFSNCSALNQIIVDSNNNAYDSRENCNAIVRTSTNALVMGCKSTVIPNSVTIIGDYAFSNCTDMISIEIPNSVTLIGKHAFINCSGLTLIESMAGTPPTLGESAFYNVPAAIPVYVPCSSLEAYQSASGWSNFTNFVGIETKEEFWESGCDYYSWHGTEYTNSGTYTFETTTLEGCQRIEILHLTINPTETVEYTITADESYTWYGETYTESGIYTFETITAQGCPRIETLHLIITHGQQLFTITASAGPNGHVSPEGEVNVEFGGLITFAITPDEGCAISQVIIDGIEYEPTETIAFTNVHSNHTIHALFWGVGVEEDEMPTLRISPNPANREVLVKCEGMRRITLYNLSGKMILDMDTYTDAEMMALDRLSPGVYVIKVMMVGNYCQYTKLIVTE